MIKKIIPIIFCIPLTITGKTIDNKYKRLDPHGKVTTGLYKSKINKENHCIVCHKKGKKKVYTDIINRCITCHNSSPHSGASEHIGKSLKPLKNGLTGKMNCLSCHRPHRALTKGMSPDLLTIEKKSFLYIKKKNFKLASDQEEIRSQAPMLKRTCSYCHNKSNLR